MPGTTCLFLFHTLPKYSPPPKLRLCLPFCQLSESSMFQFHALRQVGPFSVCQLVSVLPTLPSVSAYPPESTYVCGPLLSSSPKYPGPHRIPPLSSFTMLGESVERSAPDESGRYDTYFR